MYGTNDCGVSVHSSSPELSQKLKEIGTMLNLKPHTCGGVLLYSAVDLEGHLSHKDERFYLCDFARVTLRQGSTKFVKVFPPETPASK